MHLWTSLGMWFILKLSNIVHHLKKLSHIPWFKEKHYPINNNNWATWLFLILSDTICLYSVRRKRSIRPSCPAAYLSSLTQSQPACSRHATVSLNMLSPVPQLCMASSTPRERSESSLTARPVSTLLRSHGDFRLGHGVTDGMFHEHLDIPSSLWLHPLMFFLHVDIYGVPFALCFDNLMIWEIFSLLYLAFPFLFWNNCFCVCVFEHSVCVRLLLPQHVEGWSQFGWLRFFYHLYMGPRDRTHVARLSQQSPLPTKSSH